MDSKELAVIDEKTVVNYMTASGVGNNLASNEKKMFIEMCTLYGLNPFKREIYCTAYGTGQYRQFSIVTGYEVYLKRAERIGKLDGYDVDTALDDKGNPIKSTVTIYRKDWTHPFKHTVFFKEYVQHKKDGTVNKFWGDKPITMIEKVAKAQAFRLCFPDEFDGMPYTREEMPNMEQTENIKNITPKETAETINPNNGDVVEQEIPTETKETLKEDVDYSVNLEALVESYRIELQGKPYRLAKECLGNNGDCKEMYKRCVDYLSKKGIRV
ncbi:MAG: phage recombination protein Bet [Fibrobacter sp.]|nr:phage recombination protein Bet [Fibrobacter sp.]